MPYTDSMHFRGFLAHPVLVVCFIVIHLGVCLSLDYRWKNTRVCEDACGYCPSAIVAVPGVPVHLFSGRYNIFQIITDIAEIASHIRFFPFPKMVVSYHVYAHVDCSVVIQRVQEVEGTFLSGLGAFDDKVERLLFDSVFSLHLINTIVFRSHFGIM